MSLLIDWVRKGKFTIQLASPQLSISRVSVCVDIVHYLLESFFKLFKDYSLSCCSKAVGVLQWDVSNKETFSKIQSKNAPQKCHNSDSYNFWTIFQIVPLQIYNEFVWEINLSKLCHNSQISFAFVHIQTRQITSGLMSKTASEDVEYNTWVKWIILLWCVCV